MSKPLIPSDRKKITPGRRNNVPTLQVVKRFTKVHQSYRQCSQAVTGQSQSFRLRRTEALAVFALPICPLDEYILAEVSLCVPACADAHLVNQGFVP